MKADHMRWARDKGAIQNANLDDFKVANRRGPRVTVSFALLHCFGVTILTEVRNCRNLE